MAGQSPPHVRRARSPVLIGFVYGLTVVAATAIIGATVLVGTGTVLFDDVRAYLRAATLSAATLVDGDALATFTHPEQERTREYVAAMRPLLVLSSADSATERVFVAVIRGDSMRYVLDASPAGRPGPDEQGAHKAIGETGLAWPEARLAAGGESVVVATAPLPSPRGPVLRASTPVFAGDGRVVGVVGITLNLRHYTQQKRKLDMSVLMGGAIGILLALVSGISAFRVERSRLAAEATLTAAKAAAEASSRAKGEFVANMSHEIRTPLHGVLGMSEAMLASAHTEADRRSLEVINKSASSLLGILNDVLDYSKLEAGRVDLVNAPFDPRALVDDVTDLFAVTADQKGLEIGVRESLRADRWPVGDAARLKQVLLNLVGNAVKFTAHGYVRVDLETVMIGRQTIALRIAVKDTGIGITPEGQSRLFEQFSQGEASTARRFGGTGLGLAISRQLMLLMGGALSVSSEQDKGTAFTVDLQLPVSSTSREMPGGPRLATGSRALVWCAGPLTREAIVESFARQGIGVDTCDSTETMRARLEAPVSYALVLTDAPSRDGVVPPLLIGVRGAPPLVLLTGLHQPLNNSELARFGAAGQLRRPVREAHLESLLSDVASGRLLKLQAEASVKSATDKPAGRISPTGPECLDGVPRVMVVDDVELNLMVARAMLGSLGVHVTGASGGPSALEQLARERFDLVLMDCHMPTVDGYEVTRRVRATPGPNRETPIVALSASAFAEDRQRAIAAGMNDFAPKPIELTGLRTVLERWLPDYAPPAEPTAATSGA